MKTVLQNNRKILAIQQATAIEMRSSNSQVYSYLSDRDKVTSGQLTRVAQFYLTLLKK